MKNGHNDMLPPIRAIPFFFSMSSFSASGFSTLRVSFRKNPALLRSAQLPLCASPGIELLCGLDLLNPIPRHPIRDRIIKRYNRLFLLVEEILPSLTPFSSSEGRESSQ